MHKTGNVLNYLPKRTQPKAKKMLHDIWQAETRENAHAAFDLFVDAFEAKYPKATECLVKNRDELLTFYDFPAQHWQCIRPASRDSANYKYLKFGIGSAAHGWGNFSCHFWGEYDCH